MEKSSESSSCSTSSVSTTDSEDEGSGELVVNGKYRLGRLLGFGSFGEVFAAKDRLTGEKVAVKLEKSDAKNPQLVYEHKVLRTLGGTEGIVGFRDFGQSADGNHLALVMDLLGLSLEEQFNKCRRRFTLKTVIILAEQMINVIQRLHSKRYIHRDIKPDNFVLELDTNKVHLVDFGLARKFLSVSGKLRKHIPKIVGKSLVGTARYASINTHKGIEQSRRDDLESLGYMFVYFLKGKLPWQGLQAASRQQKEEKIFQVKTSTSIEMLCQGLPQEFVKYFHHVRGLTFEEPPAYSYLKQLFKILFETHGFQKNTQFDWM